MSNLRIDLVELPSQLTPDLLAGRTAIVFDVLRATTTMACALNAGVADILLFPSLDDARAAKPNHPQALLVGERKCVKPDDFDLGNTPQQFTDAHANATLLMATTNGTRALVASEQATHVFIGALINAAAVANAAAKLAQPITLVCAGTDGEPAPEDLLGAGAVIDQLRPHAPDLSTSAANALKQFHAHQHRLPKSLREAQGGKNIIAAGLEADIDAAAQLNALNAVGKLERSPLRIRRAF